MNRLATMVAAAGVAATVCMAQQSTQSLHVVDQAVASELLRSAVAGQTVDALAASPDLQRTYVLSIIEQELVQEAGRRGLIERFDVQRAMIQARHQILLQALQQDIGRKVAQPTEAEVSAAYRADKDRWVMSEAYHVDVYIAPTTNTAAVAALKAAAGMTAPNTERLLAAGAQRARAQQGGELWVAENDIVPEIWKALPSLLNEESRIFGVQDNVWLVRRLAHREGGPMTAEQAAPAVRAEILQKRQRERWESFVEERRKTLGL